MSDEKAQKKARKKLKKETKAWKREQRKQDLEARVAKPKHSATLTARGMTTLKVRGPKWSVITTKGTQRGTTRTMTAVLATEYGGVTKRVHGGRVGGGAVVGGLLAGPLGAVAGAGLGAAARGSHDYITVQILDNEGAPVVVAEVERKDMDKAKDFASTFNASAKE